MYQTKLIKTLKQLSAIEFNRFERYVQSPYYNSREDAIRLMAFLKEQHPDFEGEGFNTQLVWERVFPNRSFDDAHFRFLRTYLMRLFYGFIAAEENKTDGHWQLQDALYALDKKGMEGLIPNMILQAQERLENTTVGIERHLHQFRLNQFVAEHSFTEANRTKKKDLASVLLPLDQYYLIHKLRMSCSLLLRRQTAVEEYHVLLLDEILQFCASRDLTDMPIVALYYQVWLLLKVADVKAFRNIKKLLAEHQLSVPPNFLTEIYAHLINFCTRMYRKGELRFLGEMMTLYKTMLQHNLLFQHTSSAVHSYKNIVTLGLMLEEYDWTENFITTYKSYIPAEYQEGAYHYNIAHLYYYKKTYGQALSHLQRMEFIDPFFRIGHNLLLLKTYYECDEIEAFIALCGTFRTYIHRRKNMPTSRKQAYFHFIKFSRKLFRLKQGKKKSADTIRKEIENCNLLVEKKWLLQTLARDCKG